VPVGIDAGVAIVVTTIASVAVVVGLFSFAFAVFDDVWANAKEHTKSDGGKGGRIIRSLRTRTFRISDVWCSGYHLSDLRFQVSDFRLDL
jgi:hypothetical protein